MVDASGTDCGDMVGEVDRLVPVEYSMKPLWELYPDYDGMDSIKSFYEDF